MNSAAQNQQYYDSYAEHLNYDILVAPGVLLLKDGALLGAWAFSGPDLDSASSAELNLLSAQINHAFTFLGDGWMLHHTLLRFPSLPYSDNVSFHEPSSFIIDLERRERFEKTGKLFENISTLFFTFYRW